MNNAALVYASPRFDCVFFVDRGKGAVVEYRDMMNGGIIVRVMVSVVFAAMVSVAGAAPMLKTQAEPVADGELKAKVLAGSQGVPAATPESRRYVVTRGDEKRDFQLYFVRDLWRLRAFAGEWRDKRGNVMRLARVKSLIPSDVPAAFSSMPDGQGEKDAIEKALDAAEREFTGEPLELEVWKKCWGGFGSGKIFEVKGRRYYVEFEFAEAVKPGDEEKLFKAFERSVSSVTSNSSGAVSSMKWWETENPLYRFLTDLDKAKGGKFVKDAMRLVEAMRKSYEFYVPPQRPIGKCTVRVFRTRKGYYDYRAATGDDDQMSCGLWDPRREELLISAEDREQAQRTMRHEAFHQYLFYATGNGNHAMWFNEGHACFFESVKYNPAKNVVKVVDEGNRAKWIDTDPVFFANRIPAVVRMSHREFYEGDVNANYCTAWAIVYFLEKGAWTSDAFAVYRTILPKYLELTAKGVGSAEATVKAWSVAAERDVAADFLKFWREKRKAAINAR